MMTFEQLHETYHEDVYRFAFWLSRNQSEAEDLASETFARAWARRHALRTETLKAYLLAIARNTFLKHQRENRGREELPSELLDEAPGPHRQATARMELERVQRALARLPEPDRAALVLRAEQALPYAEIARILEVSEGAARVKVHRARRKLLDEHLRHEGGGRCK
jgi:RNA polymerase sigma-70 factor (ECF subfamily)